MKLAKLSYI